jgi:3-oxoacyl-[acyl-carrier protein] reductase
MALDLSGRTAVVTGSSKGIGRGIAEALARAGAHVVITARSGEEVERAAAELREGARGRILPVVCDVRDAEDVRRLFERTVAELDVIDVLVNNAGVGGFAPVPEMPLEQWRQILETNLSGVFYCCREAIPHLRRRGGGWIINISSLAGRNTFAGGAAYNASKFGLEGFTEALMQDVRHDGIRVCSIMPGSVNTEFFEGGPDPERDWMLQPEDVARAVMDLLAYPERALPSRIELRPSRPQKR